MKYKAAIIGTGKIAGLFDAPHNKDGAFTHAKVCRKNKNIDLEAACDKDIKKLNKFCRTWGIKDKYVNVDELLDNKKLDIILLCTPNRTHFTLAKKILQHTNRPRILLVEKPICLNKAELIKIKKMLADTCTKLIVNHTYRFHRGLQRVREIIKRGDFGKMLSIRAIYYGGLLNNGVHILDTLRMITGSEFRVISAEIGAKGRGNDFCVDAKLISLDYPDAKIFMESFPEEYYQLYEIEMRLESGRIRIMDFGENIFIDKVLINNSGEKELRNINKITMLKSESPLRNLFNKIIDYLADNDAAILSEIGIEEVSKTMVSLWEIRDRALKWQN
ncbi:MAG: Gfo/Idh/MocA family oxidoreductase [Candidatus Omnitrophica bacterium]|nr:Gfo/Idh/MocA family oxidoreductase [Candidatus Omnitrophota bacterium]MDD5591891.1 Gfo/Idh/MocA family oxidoreductase [Candidatus Omnitrophota bacterium]